MQSARRATGVLCGLAAALVLTACGSEGQASSPAGGTGTSGPVGTRDLDGVGTVLVDTVGRTLYFTDSDTAGEIKCTAECLDLWIPAEAPGDTVDGAPVGDLSVISRPDGTKQIAFQDKPLYTFKLDSPNKPSAGHNASDTFGGVDFTWHAAVVDGAALPQQPPKQDDGGGYGRGGGY
ncbi:MAG TPA: hypothetical protein VFV67_30755 [Actinophytocola sp.]|uniref:COG4315 family predicted lipoprotein n=1 Tax=Actinophytocola sp. TaxID=1872138 RepID=UPI002DBD2829|nr:hypothetical protein [Actinophytocola sp.]HEU5475046.1 hypothetical protein [Actinophytocola sp.]